MKTVIVVWFMLGLAAAANAAIEFAGYMTSGKVVTFALIDTADGRTGWVELGANFAGFRVAEFSNENDVLTLQREGQTLQVKLRVASFTIPAEVTGPERERVFFAKLREMQQSIGSGKKFYLPEDYIATATQYGRVIVSREVVNGVETIAMEQPEHLRPSPGPDGATQRQSFSLQMTRRDKTRVKLTVR